MNYHTTTQTALSLASPKRPRLWNFQLDLVEQVRAHVRNRKRLILLQSPTGSGKTTMAGEIVYQSVEKGKKVLFVAHRRELVEQCSARLDEFDIPHGLIMAGFKTHYSHPVQIASIQTIARKSRMPEADVVILDEAHRSVVGQFKELIEAYEKPIILGLTATPRRLDGTGLGDVYQALVPGPSMRWLIDQGFLVPPRVFALAAPDMTGVKTIAGEYDRGEMGKRFDLPKLVGNVVAEWLRYARDRVTLAFCCTVEHSMHLRDEFRKAGITSEHVDGETDKDTRRAILKRARAGEIQVLTNCALFTEGVDIKNIGCVIFARKTASITYYLQAVGRGLRADEGKSDCIILDHGGNCFEHGRPDDEREWELTYTTTKKKSSSGSSEAAPDPAPLVRICPACAYVHPNRFYGVCGNIKLDGTKCDFLMQAEVPQFAEGTLTEIVDAHVYKRGKENPDPAIAELWRIAAKRKFKPGWVYWRQKDLTALRVHYRAITGLPPQPFWNIRTLQLKIEVPEAGAAWKETGRT